MKKKFIFFLKFLYLRASLIDNVFKISTYTFLCPINLQNEDIYEKDNFCDE